MQLKGEKIVLTGAETIMFEPITVDCNDLRPSEIAAQTVFSAISPGTETAAYLGRAPLRPGNIYPRLMGYCNAAKVVKTGADVRSLKPGDIILTNESHRSIFTIKEEDILAKIPDGVAPEDAVLAYLYNLGLTSLQTIDIHKAHNVAVIGLGVLGLATIEQAGILGNNILAFSNSRYKLTLAEDLGANKTYLKHESEELEKVADLVITASNLWPDWELALRLVKDRGTICVLGFPGRGLPPPDFNPLEPKYFYDKKITIVSAGAGSDPNSNRDNCIKILGMMADKKIHPRKLVSGTYEYREIEQAYKKLLERDHKSLTYLLKWPA